jgi:hypothetical protein
MYEVQKRVNRIQKERNDKDICIENEWALLFFLGKQMLILFLSLSCYSHPIYYWVIQYDSQHKAL